jgi:hypothetical protein
MCCCEYANAEKAMCVLLDLFNMEVPVPLNKAKSARSLRPACLAEGFCAIADIPFFPSDNSKLRLADLFYART